MGLEKAGPELLLRHVVRHIFTIFLLHCRFNTNSYNYVKSSVFMYLMRNNSCTLVTEETWLELNCPAKNVPPDF